jgi:hypothetical protein
MSKVIIITVSGGVVIGVFIPKEILNGVTVEVRDYDNAEDRTGDPEVDEDNSIYEDEEGGYYQSTLYS